MVLDNLYTLVALLLLTFTLPRSTKSEDTTSVSEEQPQQQQEKSSSGGSSNSAWDVCLPHSAKVNCSYL